MSGSDIQHAMLQQQRELKDDPNQIVSEEKPTRATKMSLLTVI